MLNNDFKHSLAETWLDNDSNETSFKLKGTANRLSVIDMGNKGRSNVIHIIGFPFSCAQRKGNGYLVESMTLKRCLVGVIYRCERTFSKDSHCEWLLEELASLNKPEGDFIEAGDFKKRSILLNSWML